MILQLRTPGIGAWCVCVCVPVLRKTAYLRHHLLREANSSLAFRLTMCSYGNSFIYFVCQASYWINDHCLHSWTGALVSMLCPMELEPGLLWGSGCFLCSEAAWLLQQIGDASVFARWICAVTLLSHFTVSTISMITRERRVTVEQVRWLGEITHV